MHKVIIKDYEGNTIKTIECENERKADRVDDGININLDHDKYFTVIKEG
jgi:hypothetical protein